MLLAAAVAAAFNVTATLIDSPAARMIRHYSSQSFYPSLLSAASLRCYAVLAFKLFSLLCLGPNIRCTEDIMLSTCSPVCVKRWQNCCRQCGLKIRVVMEITTVGSSVSIGTVHDSMLPGGPFTVRTALSSLSRIDAIFV